MSALSPVRVGGPKREALAFLTRLFRGGSRAAAAAMLEGSRGCFGFRIPDFRAIRSLSRPILLSPFRIASRSRAATQRRADLSIHRLHAIRRVVPDVVDQGGDAVRLHLRGRVGLAEGSKSSAVIGPGASQRRAVPGSRIAGIRLWIGAIRSFGRRSGERTSAPGVRRPPRTCRRSRTAARRKAV